MTTWLHTCHYIGASLGHFERKASAIGSRSAMLTIARLLVGLYVPDYRVPEDGTFHYMLSVPQVPITTVGTVDSTSSGPDRLPSAASHHLMLCLCIYYCSAVGDQVNLPNTSLIGRENLEALRRCVVQCTSLCASYKADTVHHECKLNPLVFTTFRVT